ncbi:hypothetical protein AAIR98_001889 [Elusimicrobium simillimum]|uniref:DUF748 domain-containing protein n=1 Tax=Elusimicrobium simillimum TaxID=3143438 RepID=UPI003C6FA871
MTKKSEPKKRSFLTTCFIITGKAIKICLGLAIKTLTFFMLLMVVLSALSWFLFIKYFNAQQVSELLAVELQKVVGRPVAVGAVELQFFNFAKIDNVVVFDEEITSGAPILEAGEVLLQYDLLPLLKKHIHIESVVLKNPRFVITKSPEGNFNVPQIKVAAPTVSAPAAQAQDFASRPITFKIDDWEIDNGTFVFRDMATNHTQSIYSVNMKFTDLDLNKRSRFETDFTVRNSFGNTMTEVLVKAGGHVNFANFNWQKFNLRNTDISLSFFKKPVTINMDMDNLKNPFISLTMNIPALNDEDLSLFLTKPMGINFPAAKVSANTSLKNGYQQFAVTKLSWAGADIKATASANLQFEKDKPVKGDFTVKTDYFNLADKHNIYGEIKQYNLTGQASVNMKADFAEGKFNIPNLEVQLKEAAGKAGKLNGGFNIGAVTGTAYAKDNFAVLGAKTTTGTLKIGKQTFTEVAGTCEYKKNTLNGFVTHAKINNVPMKLAVDIFNFKSDVRRRITTKLYMQEIDIMPFYEVIEDFVYAIAKPSKTKFSAKYEGDDLGWLHMFKDGIPNFMRNFKGFITADYFKSTVLSGRDLLVEFDLTGLLPGLGKLDGKLDAQLENGTIYQLEKKAEQEKALGIVFQPFIVMHRMEKAGSFKINQALKDVNYKKILLSTDFKNGKMDILNVYSDGGTLGVAAKGNVDWAQEKMDATIWTIFRNTSRSGALAENLTDASGAPALSFRVHDRMSSPKVEMLRPRTSGAEIKSSIEKGIRTDFSDAKKFKP